MTDSGLMMRQLVELNRMSLSELKEKYAELYGEETKCASVKGLRQRLAYRLQEVFLGGLSPEDERKLEAIALRDPTANLEMKATPVKRGVIPCGTRFSREWHGKVYEVIATGQGTFEYNGCYYRSLTAVANKITGTSWNGKKFFGVR